MREIDGARKDFQESLRRKAAAKKKHEREMAKLGLKKHVKKPGEARGFRLLDGMVGTYPVLHSEDEDSAQARPEAGRL